MLFNLYIIDLQQHGIGTGHGMGHGTGHGVGHGTGQGTGHGTGQGTGHGHGLEQQIIIGHFDLHIFTTHTRKLKFLFQNRHKYT